MLIHSFKKIPDTINVLGTGTLAKQCHISCVTVTAVACDIRNVTVSLFPGQDNFLPLLCTTSHGYPLASTTQEGRHPSGH